MSVGFLDGLSLLSLNNLDDLAPATMVPPGVLTTVGAVELSVGLPLGFSVGLSVGLLVGLLVGFSLGLVVEFVVGLTVELSVGILVLRL